MPNKTIKDDVVKWFSKKKYPCKRNKGEHEYGEPVITFPPSIKYLYKIEARCKHCGKKSVAYLSDKLI